ncbi:Na(+)/H(+)-K(+) antiporter GerN [Streptomyces hundungensis]|uniref:Na(+)/H(+)-K(+) antiporter GerN n=1 Tax=Streptomyces hundungensis TaxID=1077946 RepID=A0A387HSD7_9ACTN|nr:Na(+)/H(+)-K(+) antiporter GerN [Streptomyces hundungensis]
MSHPGTLILLMAIAVLAPLLAYGVRRWIPVPLVIFEIVLGIFVGPDVLDWAHHDQVIDTLSNLGLTMLIFLAGYEIDFAAVPGDTLRRSVTAWLISLAAALGIAFALTGAQTTKSFVIGTALTSTALGTVLPILRDSGDLRGRFGTVVLAFGAVGEFGPVIAMALLLSGRAPGRSTAVLLAFAAITAAAVWWALRPRPRRFSHLIRKTLHSGGQFAVRYVMLLLAAMLGLSQVLGIDTLLGAFAAGVITPADPARRRSGQQLRSPRPRRGDGLRLPRPALLRRHRHRLRPRRPARGRPAPRPPPVLLALFLLVRGLPQYALAPPDLPRHNRLALLLYGSTCLPLVVAITTICLDDKAITSGEAAALVGAAMVSVLAFPLIALRIRARGGEPATRPSAASESAEPW